MTPRSRIAHLWVAPGVKLLPYELGDVETHTRWPREIYAKIVRPFVVRALDLIEDHTPEEAAIFRLTNYAKGGTVAHYDLISKPPAGKVWHVVKGYLVERSNR